jgi:hypothetical protein
VTALTLAIDIDGNIRELDNRHGIPYSIEDYESASVVNGFEDWVDILKEQYKDKLRQNLQGDWYIERGNIE